MGKIALITGATSGIGEATARLLSAEGYDVVVTGRRAERLRELKKELEGEFSNSVATLCFDIRDRLATESALETLPEHFQQIDVLINNAGLAAGLEHIDKGRTADWDAMVDTNIKGLLYVTRIVAEKMAKRKTGHIVNLGSIAGTQPYESGNVYCATKHAVHALSQSMRIDLLSHGVKVTEIRPGMAQTEFSLIRFAGDKERADNVYSGVTPLSSEDIAETIFWAVSQPAHVNIDEVVLTSLNQANAYYTHRN